MYIHLLGSQDYKDKQGVPGFLGKIHWGRKVENKEARQLWISIESTP